MSWNKKWSKRTCNCWQCRLGGYSSDCPNYCEDSWYQDCNKENPCQLALKSYEQLTKKDFAMLRNDGSIEFPPTIANKKWKWCERLGYCGNTLNFDAIDSDPYIYKLKVHPYLRPMWICEECYQELPNQKD